jgi:hypothetical protein
MMHEHAPFEKLAFLYSGSPDPLQELISQSSDLVQVSHPWQELINPVLGAHIGPGVIGFAGVSERRI